MSNTLSSVSQNVVSSLPSKLLAEGITSITAYGVSGVLIFIYLNYRDILPENIILLDYSSLNLDFAKDLFITLNFLLIIFLLAYLGSLLFDILHVALLMTAGNLKKKPQNRFPAEKMLDFLSKKKNI